MESTERLPATKLDEQVAEIVSRYLVKNQVAPADLPRLITAVYETLHSLGKVAEPEPSRMPAVSIRQSVTRDYVVCLECGWRGTTLRRHIGATHGLVDTEYRARWNLPREHALVAPRYSEKRSELAKQIGLGARMGRNRDRPNTTEASDVQ